MKCDRFCPWVQDANNPNRYVCLDCDRQRQIDRTEPPWLLIIFSAAFIVWAIHSDSPNNAPAIENTDRPYYEQSRD